MSKENPSNPYPSSFWTKSYYSILKFHTKLQRSIPLLCSSFFLFFFFPFLFFPYALSCLETKMSYFCLPPLFIIRLSFICLLVLQVLTICISIFHYFILASNLINLRLLSPLLTNYNFVLMSWYNFRVSKFPFFAFNLRKIQFMLTKYPKHVEND